MRSPVGSLVGAIPRTTSRTPVPFVGRASAGLPARAAAGAEQHMRAMGGVGTLFAIVDRLSNSVAQVDWSLYQKAKSGKAEDRKQVTSHRALDVWNQPNKFMTRQELVESCQQHYELTGEGWLVVGRHERFRAFGPLELWPVRPDRMEPIPSTEGFLSGYEYRSPDGQVVPLELDDVIQMRRPNPIDPYRGIGAVQTILTDLEGVKLSAQWNRNFFANSAEPGGIVQIDRRLSDDEFDELTARWREQHQGVANSHRVAILEQAQWVDRKYSMRDMQFTELRSVSRDVIREAFGIPKFAIGDVEDINRATANASKAWFAEQLTVPRLERIKQALNNDFLPLFFPPGATIDLEFDYDDPVPADREADNEELTTKARAAAELTEAGYYAPEVLAAVGLPEIAFGQPGTHSDPDRELLIKLVTGAPLLAPMILPMLGFDVPAAPAQPGQAPGKAQPAALLRAHRRDVASGPDLFAVAGVAPWPALNAADDPPERLDPQDLPDVTPAHRSWEQALAALLSRWGGIVADQIRDLIDQIRQLIRSGDVEDLPAITAPTGDATRALRQAVEDLAGDAAGQVVAEAAAQDVEIEAGAADAAALEEIAVITVALLANNLASSAAGEAERVRIPGEAGEQEADRVADLVTEHLESLTDAQPKQRLGAALHSAQHAGRRATFEQAEGDLALPSVAYYGSEVRDGNTCRLCKEVDGRWLGNTYAEAVAEYPGGGYVRCEGRDRCRGDVVAVWRGGADRKGWLEKEPVTI